ncbi:hypothetical protein ABK040_006900 [Willaertia magna]
MKQQSKELNLFCNYCEMKIAIVGEGGVGKSSITIRYQRNVFLEEYDPTIEDHYRRCLKVDENTYYLDIIDTPGQEEFKSLRDQHLLYSKAILSVCDLTDKRTLEEVKNTIVNFYRVKDQDDLPIVIVGNKLDLIEQDVERREITKEMVEELVVENVCKESKLKPIYIETSAKTGYNIDEAFIDVVRLAEGRYIDWNDVIKRLLKGEKLLKEFESKSRKCILM